MPPTLPITPASQPRSLALPQAREAWPRTIGCVVAPCICRESLENETMHSVRAHGALALILMAYLALGLTYSVVDPILEASDEIFHYPVVKQIADGRGLPIQDPRDKDSLWMQEGSQPPLYYLIGAAITAWIDTGPMESVMLKNPHAQIGRPGARNNKNMVVHSEEEDFPYHGVSLAVHLIRVLSVLMGAGTVALTYFIVLTVAPGNRVL